MKNILLFIFCVISTAHAQTKLPVVNAIIGDESFVSVFGYAPDNETSEKLRVQTHLLFVEEMLRKKSAAHLSSELQERRTKILDLLHAYTLNGLFPVNARFPGERRPCFIDDNGNICAVGFLIARTAGIELAKEINKDHQYDKILDMHEPIVETWASEHGLTLQECAMIQPAYGAPPVNSTEKMPVVKSYGIASGFLGGINVGVSMLNLSNRPAGKTVSCVGIISGTAQVLLGLTNFRKSENISFINGYTRSKSYEAQNTVCYLNITAGTATILTSAINLYINGKIKDKRNALHIFSSSRDSYARTMGVSFLRVL